jgi:F-type H+/Na+-transporting ATPase subunit alpha
VTRNQIETGQRMTELLKQGQYQPMPVEEQVASLWMAGNGYLADVTVENVRAFEAQYLEYLRTARPEVLAAIKTQQAIDDDLTAQLKSAADAFKAGSEFASARVAVVA